MQLIIDDFPDVFSNVWMFPGFSVILTIHFGVFPYFRKHPYGVSCYALPEIPWQIEALEPTAHTGNSSSQLCRAATTIAQSTKDAQAAHAQWKQHLKV